MREGRLSLCMIVKNEEDCIGRCLASVQGIVDEMIVVDTGSTDGTKEICASYGARVLEFPWNGSFADARNHGLVHASGDWILWLDADEAVDEKDGHRLRNVFKFESNPIVNIRLVNYYSKEADDDKVLEIAHPRLLRNHIGLCFVGNIHEALNVQDVHSEAETDAFLDVKVYHYGYMKDVVARKDKIKRNLDLLMHDLKDGANLNWTHYHLATEYARLEQFEEAYQHVNLAIMHFLQKGLMPPSLAYKLKYSILINTGSWDGAWPAIERAVALYPDYVDLRFYMGFILLQKEMVREALDAFERCIEIGEENLKHLVTKGLGSFQAWYLKGICHEKLNQQEQAIEAYSQALKLCPNFGDAREALDKIWGS